MDVRSTLKSQAGSVTLSGVAGDEAVAGIELPPGDPGSVREAAQGLRGVASGFQRTGSVARQAAASVSWEGVAASGFMARTGDYGDAAAAADAACTRAGAVLARFAERLEEGRERVRKLQDLAEQARTEMTAALANAQAAGQRASTARDRAVDATVGAAFDGGTFSAEEGLRALGDATEAEADQTRFEGIAQRAREELERLRVQAGEEREAVRQAASAAAGAVEGAQAALPVVAGGAMLGPSPAALTGAPFGPLEPFGGGPMGAAMARAAASDDGEEDEPGFWEKTWDGMLGRVGDGTPLQVPLEVAESLSPGFREDFGRGLVEDPVVGVKELAVTGVQLSPSYRLFDPAGQDRRAAQLRDTATFAYREPGEFLKQAGGVDHIEDGQPGRFIGGWAAIFATGGAGAAIKAPAAVTRAIPGESPNGGSPRAAPEGDRPTPRDPPARPSWRQSEVDVGGRLGDGYEEQRSFLGGQPVDGNPSGSVRPDWFGHGEAIEVKNYDVESSAGRSRLVSTVGSQIEARARELPPETAQRVYLDVRGQSLSVPDGEALAQRISARTGNTVPPDGIVIIRR